MRKQILPALFLCLPLVFLLGAAAAGPAAAQGNSPYEIIQLVNEVRASHGLYAYETNGALMIAAQSHANWMAANIAYTHSGEGGSSPSDRARAAGYGGYVSENIVGGTRLTPGQGVTWWINSPVHFNTMISTRYTQIGTGAASNGEQNFYVLVVGSPSDRPPAAAETTANTATAPVIVPAIAVSAPREDGSIVHVARAGHTFWAIAARYEVNLAELYLLNGLNEDSVLQPGQQLTIRLAEGQAPPPTPTPPTSHVVRPGETAWTIAARYRIDLAEFFWLNGLNEDSVIHPGDEVVIRLAEGQAPPPTPTPQMSHVVQSGDTLLAIAGRYGLTLDNLLAFNGIAVNVVLQPGQELLIRPPTETPTATAAATAVADTATEPVAVAALSVAPLPGATRTPAPAQATVIVAPEARPVTSGPDAGRAVAAASLLLGGGVVGLGVAIGLLIRRQEGEGK